MKNKKNLVYRFCGMIASLALMITAMNVNVACAWLVHQPKLPKGSEKLRKF